MGWVSKNPEEKYNFNIKPVVFFYNYLRKICVHIIIQFKTKVILFLHVLFINVISVLIKLGEKKSVITLV